MPILEQLYHGSFGVMDGKFAVHALDEDKAKKFILEAKAQGYSERFIESLVAGILVNGAPVSPECMNENLKTLKSILKKG